MIIRKVEIREFGKLENFVCHFTEGGQLLTADNESGKSTLLEFIFACLYGMPGRAAKDPLKSRRFRYLPWDKKKMGGSLEVEHEGQTYRIVVSFGAAPRTDRFALYRLPETEEIDLENQSPGEFLLKMDGLSFRNTVYIPQMNVPLELDEGKREELIQRLSRLSIGAADEAGYVGVREALLAAEKKLRSRSQGAALNRLEKRAEEAGAALVEARLRRDEEDQMRRELLSLQKTEKEEETDLKEKEKLLYELRAATNHLRVREAKAEREEAEKRIRELQAEALADAARETPLEPEALEACRKILREKEQQLERSEARLYELEEALSGLYDLDRKREAELEISSQDYAYLQSFGAEEDRQREALRRKEEELRSAKEKVQQCRARSEQKAAAAQAEFVRARDALMELRETQNEELQILRAEHDAALKEQFRYEKSLNEAEETYSQLLKKTAAARAEIDELREEQEALRAEMQEHLSLSEAFRARYEEALAQKEREEAAPETAPSPAFEAARAEEAKEEGGEKKEASSGAQAPPAVEVSAAEERSSEARAEEANSTTGLGTTDVVGAAGRDRNADLEAKTEEESASDAVQHAECGTCAGESADARRAEEERPAQRETAEVVAARQKENARLATPAAEEAGGVANAVSSAESVHSVQVEAAAPSAEEETRDRDRTEGRSLPLRALNPKRFALPPRSRRELAVDEQEELSLRYLQRLLDENEEARFELYREYSRAEAQLEQIERETAAERAKRLGFDPKSLPSRAELAMYPLAALLFTAAHLAGQVYRETMSEYLPRAWADSPYLGYTLFGLALLSLLLLLGRGRQYFKLRRFIAIDRVRGALIEEKRQIHTEKEAELARLEGRIRAKDQERAVYTVELRDLEERRTSRLFELSWIRERLKQIHARIYRLNHLLQEALPEEREALCRRDALLSEQKRYSEPLLEAQRREAEKNLFFIRKREEAEAFLAQCQAHYEECRQKDQARELESEEKDLSEKVRVLEKELFSLQTIWKNEQRTLEQFVFKLNADSKQDLMKRLEAKQWAERSYLAAEDRLIGQIRELQGQFAEDRFSELLCPWLEPEEEDFFRVQPWAREVLRSGAECLREKQKIRAGEEEYLLDEFLREDEWETAAYTRHGLTVLLTAARTQQEGLLRELERQLSFLRRSEERLFRQSEEIEQKKRQIARIDASLGELLEIEARTFSDEQPLAFVERVRRHARDLGSEQEARKAAHELEWMVRDGEQRIASLRNHIARKDEQIRERFRGGKDVEQCVYECEALEKERALLEERADALAWAARAAAAATDRLRENFWPQLRGSAARYLEFLTDGKYRDLSVEKDLRMRIFDEQGFAHDASYLSGAAYEQIYLSLRLALSELLGEGQSLPLLLDDVAVQFDEKRLANCLRLFTQRLENASEAGREKASEAGRESARETGQNSQILYFSCQDRVGQALREINATWREMSWEETSAPAADDGKQEKKKTEGRL